MTVFGALMFLIMAGFLYVCIDGSLIHQAKSRCAMVQTGLGEHLLANYNVPLAENYNLYFLDPEMRPDTMEERASAYYKEMFSSGDGIFTKSLWNLQEKETEIDVFGTMQEDDCVYFKEQIKECMKYDLTKEVFFKMFEMSAREMEEQSVQTKNRINELEKQESTGEEPGQAGDTLMPSEPADDYSGTDGVESTDSLKKIKTILEHGLLGFVTDADKLSEREISSSLLPFQNLQENGISLSMDIIKNMTDISGFMEKYNLGQMAENLTDRGMLSIYGTTYFGYYGEYKEGERDLLYEGEYILAGHSSDKENLEYVVNRLVLLRLGMNAAYAFTDASLREQAYAIAGGIAALTGFPELVEAARYTILAAVSLIESVSDVKDLLEGYRVPILKTADSWKTSMDGSVRNRKETISGLIYRDYLMLLMMMTSDEKDVCLRMQNLMQLNIRKVESSFQITGCMSGIKINSTSEVTTRFTGKTYTLLEEGTYEY